MEIHQFQKPDQLQRIDRFHIRKKQKLAVVRYHVHTADEQGRPGDPVAFVEEKRLTFDEHATIYTDEGKGTVLAQMRKHELEGLRKSYAVTDADGAELGVFGKKVGTSFYRSTWVLNQTGIGPVVVSERSRAMAVFRRAWMWAPWPGDVEVPFLWKYHLDLTGDGQHRGALEKAARLSDEYVLSLADDVVDRRLALGLAIGLDALQYN